MGFYVHAILAFYVFVAALIGFTWARRGRRVDAHPLCRRCGYDLVGLPAADRCPECGADMAGGRGVKTGNRQRRGGMMWAAGLLTLTSAGWLGTRGYVEVRDTDWQRHKPVWWLLRESADNNRPANRDAAIEEFRRRLADNELSDSQLRVIVSRALDYQADQSRPWTKQWNMFVDDAYDAGRITKEEWQRNFQAWKKHINVK